MVEKPEAPQNYNSKRKLWVGLFVFLVLLAAAACFIYYWWWGRFEQYTDDAYVSGNIIALTPQIPGIVVSINAIETDLVEKNQLIVQLDTTDPSLAYEMSKAEFAESLRLTTGMFENVARLKAERKNRNALLIRAALDYEHRNFLVSSGGVSKEDFEHSALDLSSAFSLWEEADHQLIAAISAVQNTTVLDHPLVLSAKDKLMQNYVNLQRCRILAPDTGMIGQRKAQVGERVEPGEPLMGIIPLDQIWVYANFKEVQLTKMKIGQQAIMTADIYGSDVIYHGKVVGIGAGTGSVFSIIPPQNATGNWIKIVQRVPVKIALDPDEIKKNPLRLGLSMEVTVDLHDISGSSIPPIKPPTPVYQTDIFAKQLTGVEEEIDKVITENVAPLFLEESYYSKLFMEP
jgi:membrane fusion protein, multidrug efflux system